MTMTATRPMAREVVAPAQWTATLVFERLCNAARIAQVCVKHPGPSRSVTANIFLTKGNVEEVDFTARAKRTSASPAEVSMMEEALTWLIKYEPNEISRLMLSQLIRARAIGGNFRRVCRERGWGKTRAYENCNISLRCIAGALNARGVPVRL